MSESNDRKAFRTVITAAIGYCELSMWQDAWDEPETLKGLLKP